MIDKVSGRKYKQLNSIELEIEPYVIIVKDSNSSENES